MKNWQIALRAKWDAEKEYNKAEKEHNKAEKEYNKPENKKIPSCSFCGKEAKKSVLKTNGKIALSCFDCIPDYCDLPWIKSIKKI